jgi:hypothetical protein
MICFLATLFFVFRLAHPAGHGQPDRETEGQMLPDE